MKKITLLLLLLSTRVMAGPVPNTFSFHQEGFVENKGQVRDQRGKPNDKVQFIYSNGLFNLQLKATGFSYELFEVVNNETGLPESGIRDQGADELINLKDDHSQFTSHRIDVKFLGANSSPEISAQQSTGVTFNFYTSGLPECGVTGVQSYYQVTYKNIYPGIDLVFYAPDEENETPLKYEWMIHSGADPSKIKLQYAGATAMIPLVDGGFNLKASTGTIEESKPVAFFQDDHSFVQAAYRFDNNKVSYQIIADKDRTIVIDPNIIWSGYFGGNLSDDISNGDLTVDGQGKTIIAGNTSSTQYIASTGAFQTTFAGGLRDGFIAKFTATGSLSWATYYGGTEKDECHAVVTDASNNIFVSGLTVSTSGISTTGSYQSTFGGWQDAFVAKFNGSGVRQWATYLGGSVQDEILNTTLDAFGNLYFSGYTTSPNQIATAGAYQTSLNNSGGNNGDAFLGEFTPGGHLVWCSYFSGPAQDRAHSIALGKNSDLFIEGTAESMTNIATAGTHQSTYGGGTSDAFIAKWDTNGNFIWGSYYGGNYDDHGRGVKTDADGNPYIIGWTYSDNGISTPGALQPNWYEAYENNGDRKPDGFIAKFHADGSLEWGTYYGGAGKDQAWAISVDQENDVIYAAGFTTSPQNISTIGSFQPGYSGTQDGYLVKLTSAGARDWGTYFGANNVESFYTVDLSKSGFLHLLMETDGNSFPITPGVYQTTSHGGSETIVIKFSVSDSCFDSYEPNNAPSAAKTIKAFSDTTLYGYTGSIVNASDADWFKVKVSPTNLKIELTDLSADYDLKLYKTNGQVIKMSTNTGTADESIIYNNIPKATYGIEIAHSNTAYDPYSCYRLKAMISSTPWVLKTESSEALSAENPVQVHVYPNPCSEQVTMKITCSKPEKIQTTIYNLLHQPLISSAIEMEEGSQTISFPVKQLTAGMYLLEVIYDGEKITKMIAVQ